MQKTENPAVTGEGTLPRRLETKTCTRCGGSGRMPFSVYGGICFKCNGAGKFYTKRGYAARAYWDRLRQRTLSEVKPGMLVWFEGFSCGSISIPSKFNVVESISELKECGRSKIGNEDWKTNYGHDLICSGHSWGGLQPTSLLRVGQTGLGKRETLRLALDFQDKLTKSGTLRKGETFPTAEEVLATTDTSAWVVTEAKPKEQKPVTTVNEDEAALKRLGLIG